MRPTWKDCERMSDRYGSHPYLWQKYLELSDGNEELALLVKDYYRGEGKEKGYTIGKVIREFWLKDM